MTFNRSVPWSIPLQAGHFKVRDVATHEWGHSVWLNHPADFENGVECRGATMRQANAGVEWRESLTLYDQRGVHGQYPDGG